jgi:hypothetical protein
MIDLTSKALQAMHEIFNTTEYSIANAVSYNSQFSAMHLSFTALSHHQRELQRALIKIRTICMLSESGRLHPFILSPSRLLDILRSARSRLNTGIEFALFNSDNIFPIYSIAKVRLLRKAGSVLLLAVLPLQKKDLQFKVFRAYSVPILSPNGNHAVMLKPESLFLAVNYAQDRFLRLDADYTRHCVEGDVLVCPPSFPILSNRSNSCSVAAFLNSSRDIKNFCEPYSVRLPFAQYIKGEGAGQWLYSVSKETFLNLTCPKNSSSVMLKGTGTLILPRECSASDGITFLEGVSGPHDSNYSLDFNLSVEPTVLQLQSLKTSSFPIEESELKQLEDTLHSIEVLNTHKVPAISLAEISRQGKMLEPIEKKVRFSQYAGIPVFILLGLMIVGGGCTWVRRRKLRREGSSSTPTPPPPTAPAVQVFNLNQTGETCGVAQNNSPLFPVWNSALQGDCYAVAPASSLNPK